MSVVKEATDFFKARITEALDNQKVAIHPNTEFYLVDLLTRFISSDNLFTVDENGARRQEVLALLFGAAMSSPSAGEKQRGLRRLGDVSLYTAGFFQDSLARKIVDVDYYIGMGRNAYGSLAADGRDALFQTVFSELARQFHRFVDVLGEVSAADGAKDSKDILRQYDLWLKTRSERAEKKLKQAGIIPNKLVKPDWQ